MMREPAIADVSSRYGAPMGRRGDTRNPPAGKVKVALRRIRINAQGYDAGGAYWGVGAPLYWAGTESGDWEAYFRARDREAAKRYVAEQLTGATFHR